MDLLGEQKKKNEKSSAQKLVLTLLIVSIVLCVIIGLAIAFLSIQTPTSDYSITINKEKADLGILKGEDQKNYISLRKLSEALTYSYYNGEYGVEGENRDKGYIANKTNITQFYANSNKIFKTEQNATTDYAYYELTNNIIANEDNLYICVDDIPKALNLVTQYSAKSNQLAIQTPEYIKTTKAKDFEESGIKISENDKNLKAMAYNYLVINKNDATGVINLQGQEIIGNKYASLEFCEYTNDFIASNKNNKFGVIKADGTAKINLQYDSIEILNYEPLLYKVGKSGKFGIVKEDGTVLNNIIYSSIGYPKNENQGTDYTLIIPKLNENLPESIVVCENGKYGLIDLETGKSIIDCDLKGIYSGTTEEKTYYIIETQQGNRMFLENYINEINKITVTVQQ